MFVGELGVSDDLACEVENEFRRCLAKCGRTVFVSRVRPESRANHRPTRRKWTACPPDVERGNMPMPNRLLPTRMSGNAFDWQVNFNKTLGVRSHFVIFNGTDGIKILFREFLFRWSDRPGLRQFFIGDPLAI